MCVGVGVCVCVCVCVCVRLVSHNESRIYYTSACNYVATNFTLRPTCLHFFGVKLISVHFRIGSITYCSSHKITISVILIDCNSYWFVCIFKMY